MIVVFVTLYDHELILIPYQCCRGLSCDCKKVNCTPDREEVSLEFHRKHRTNQSQKCLKKRNNSAK